MAISLNSKICSYVAKEPRASSEICDHFPTIPRSTVKAAISRLVSEGRLFRPKLRLAHGNSIITDFENFEDARLLKKLYQGNFFGRETIRLLLEYMQTSQPSISLVEVAKIAVLRIGKGPSFDWQESITLIESLCEIGMVTKEKSREELRWVLNKKVFLAAGMRFSSVNVNPAFSSIRERVKADLGKALSTWLMQNNFVSPGFKVIDQNTPVVSYGLHPFDFLGFSFTKGVAIRQKSKTQPKPVIGDIIFDVCTPIYAKAFKSRVDEVTAVTRDFPIPFILAKGFSKEAFTFLKAEGVLTWTIDQLFGKKTALAIEDTLKLCEQLIRKADVDPKLFVEALDGLENFGSVFGNLKGKLFEILFAYFITKLGYENVQIGRPVPAGKLLENGQLDKEYDLDVFASKAAEGLFAECKGVSEDTLVEDSEVTKHFEKRSPQMRKFILNTPQNRLNKFRSIVVTSGFFSSDILAAVELGKLKQRSDTSVELWDRQRLLREFKEANEGELVSVLERFY